MPAPEAIRAHLGGLRHRAVGRRRKRTATRPWASRTTSISSRWWHASAPTGDMESVRHASGDIQASRPRGHDPRRRRRVACPRWQSHAPCGARASRSARTSASSGPRASAGRVRPPCRRPSVSSWSSAAARASRTVHLRPRCGAARPHAADGHRGALVTARGDERRPPRTGSSSPGRARVTTRRDEQEPSRDYEVWLLGDGTVTTYLAAATWPAAGRCSARWSAWTSRDLPGFARQRTPLTALPTGQPGGRVRPSPWTLPQRSRDRAARGGRPGGDPDARPSSCAAEHPRASKVLVDRPDRSIEVAVDRRTGLLLRLSERLAVKRYA